MVRILEWHFLRRTSTDKVREKAKRMKVLKNTRVHRDGSGNREKVFLAKQGSCRVWEVWGFTRVLQGMVLARMARDLLRWKDLGWRMGHFQATPNGRRAAIQCYEAGRIYPCRRTSFDNRNAPFLGLIFPVILRYLNIIHSSRICLIGSYFHCLEVLIYGKHTFCWKAVLRWLLGLIFCCFHCCIDGWELQR